MANLYGTLVASQTSNLLASTIYNGSRKAVSKLTLGADADANYIRFLTSEAAAAAKVKGLIYADNSGPGDLLHVSDELEGVEEGYNWLFFPAPVTLAAGTYWVGLISDTALATRSGFVSNSLAYNTNAYGDGPSDPFGAFTYSSGTQHVALFLSGEDTAIAKAVAYSVLTVPQGSVPKALAYAVLSTEVTVSVAKAVAYAVIVEGVEGVQPVVFIIT